ncbi:MAG: PAS domain S-box protein, partial [Syntrophales bacterium]|nr:PAS domain S-box protein [Syntrophales bacterium]
MGNENEKQLLGEIEELRIKLREAEETISAIRGGGVDAIVVSGLKGEQVFTLTGAGRAYRVLIETMNEGAASLNREGLIIYCNQRLSEMINTPLEKVIGAPMRQLIQASDLPVFDRLMEKRMQECGKGEVALINSEGTVLPVLLSVSSAQRDNVNICGITVTDLTAQKQIEEELRRHRDNLEELVKVRTNELESANQQLQEEITERKNGEEALKEVSEFNRQVIESAQEGIIVYGPDLKYQRWNSFMERLTGLPAAEVLGRYPLEVFPFLIETGVIAGIEKALEGEVSEADRFQFHIPKTGRSGWASEIIAPLKSARGDIIGVISTVRDITEYLKLEAQLLHSQKMEAVGQLAGGIAHDFNNALTAILGFGKLLLMKRSEDELTKNYVQHIIDAGESAASLVQGILAFSRKQTILPKPIDITELVGNVKKMLLRLIGEDIELNTVFSDSRMIVKADPTQIEQILMNLATNARDAMPDGGTITLSMEPVKLDDEFIKAHGYGKPGPYAMISFADTGTGIDEETKKRIFEPFFTTKEVGKGTGLGLSMVYGIIKQHEGFINVYSEPGIGTNIKIYLPLMDQMAGGKETKESFILPRGTEMVLLVEDDERVRKITLSVLEDFGYHVILAVNGEDAISKFKENKDRIQLCISDMVMPKLGGREAYEEMRKIRPDLRVIFMSGYAADKTKGIIDEGLDFISKPVSPSDFLRKVREVLD